MSCSASLWRKGESLSVDVIDELSIEKGVAPNTVRTIIFRLEDKGAFKTGRARRQNLDLQAHHFSGRYVESHVT